MTRKPRRHVRILIYRTWAICHTCRLGDNQFEIITQGVRWHLEVPNAAVQLADLRRSCRRHELLEGSGGTFPREILKVGLSKVQFPALRAVVITHLWVFIDTEVKHRKVVKLRRWLVTVKRFQGCRFEA